MGNANIHFAPTNKNTFYIWNIKHNQQLITGNFHLPDELLETLHNPLGLRRHMGGF